MSGGVLTIGGIAIIPLEPGNEVFGGACPTCRAAEGHDCGVCGGTGWLPSEDERVAALQAKVREPSE